MEIQSLKNPLGFRYRFRLKQGLHTNHVSFARFLCSFLTQMRYLMRVLFNPVTENNLILPHYRLSLRLIYDLLTSLKKFHLNKCTTSIIYKNEKIQTNQINIPISIIM